MARAIDKQTMLDLIVEAKRTDPEAGPFSEWLAEYLVDHLPTLATPSEWVSVEDDRGGIKVCKEWADKETGFPTFVKWVKEDGR